MSSIGVFQLSVWDLVGAIQLDRDELEPSFLADGDTRWLNRPAYDLLGSNLTKLYFLPLIYAFLISVTNFVAKEREGSANME